MKLFLAGFGLAAAIAAPAAPAFSPWFGTWHLDRSASQFRGENISIGQAAGGYRFDFGAASFTIGDDGKFYPTVAGRETSLTRLGNGRWRRVHRTHGADVDTSLLSVSADGRTLTIATTAPGRADTIETLRRVGRGTGLAGTWRSTRLGVNAADTLSFSDAGQGRIRWGAPEDGNFYEAIPNGTPAANQGRTAVTGVTLRLHADSQHRFRWTEFINGKALDSGTDLLAADGRTLTETRWPINNPAEKQVAVYRR